MRKRLSPGVILGVVAVVFACAGSATAGSLITSGKIKDGTIQGRDIKKGTISSDRLASSVRTQLKKAGKTGATGATGPAGAPGTSVQGSAPQQGEKGEKGDAGVNGVNAATLIAKSGDAGWNVMGGGTGKTYPSANLAGGELRLHGGHDGDTPAGGIGFGHAYDKVPLSTLTALSYDFRILKRPAGTVNAPVIHITLNGTKAANKDGFTNLVFEPYQNGTFDLNQRYSLDAMGGTWWSTKVTGAVGGQSDPLTLDEFKAENPGAVIMAISVDNGGSSSNTIPAADFEAAADNLVLGFGSSFTRYDFGG